MGRDLFAGNARSHRLAGAKGHHAPRQDRHFDPRLGIAADPLRLVAQHEGSESRNFHILADRERVRSEEHTSELQSLMRISNAVFCLKKQKIKKTKYTTLEAKK